jgi:hypothetical protein
MRRGHFTTLIGFIILIRPEVAVHGTPMGTVAELQRIVATNGATPEARVGGFQVIMVHLIPTGIIISGTAPI